MPTLVAEFKVTVLVRSGRRDVGYLEDESAARRFVAPLTDSEWRIERRYVTAWAPLPMGRQNGRVGDDSGVELDDGGEYVACSV